MACNTGLNYTHRALGSDPVPPHSGRVAAAFSVVVIGTRINGRPLVSGSTARRRARLP